MTSAMSAQDDVWRQLRDCMKGDGSTWMNFFCVKDLKKIWKEVKLDQMIELFGAGFVTRLWIGYPHAFRQLYDLFARSGKQKLDLPMPQSLILQSLPGLSEQIKNRIMLEQYLFCPLVIQEEKLQKTAVFNDDSLRLPFAATSSIGSGAYGDCYQAEIPPGYIVDTDNRPWDKTYLVACKEFRDIDRDCYEREIKTLRLLQESIRRPENIMVHFAGLYHRKKYTIVLPLATHGDLHQFLYAGRTENLETPGSILAQDISRDLYKHRQALFQQSADLAEALKWLHYELRVEAENVYCAHMDLKPDNIMIKDDPRSTVGRWVLGDWGLSVFDESTGRQHASLQALGDRLNRLSMQTKLTMKVRAEREAGTYQAPEAEFGGPYRARRRSDVWSFACIFSEVLAFACGGWNMVQSFQEARAGGSGNDRFCVPSSMPSTLAPTTTQQLQVRPEVIEWLNELPDNSGFNRTWLECCTAIVKKYLVIDSNARPNSNSLHEDLFHAVHHFRNSGPGQRFVCYLINSRKNSSTDHRILPEPSNEPIWEPPQTIDAKTLLGLPEDPLKLSTSRSSDTTLAISPAVRLSLLNPQPTEVHHLVDSKASIRHLTLSADGSHISFLGKHRMEVFQFDVVQQRYSLAYRVDLRKGVDWKEGKSCAQGSMIRGFSSIDQKDVVVISDHDTNNIRELDLSPATGLTSVEMSTSGILILVYKRQLLYTSIRAVKEGLRKPRPFHASDDYIFSSAAFSHDDEFLNVWCFGIAKPFLLESWRHVAGSDLQPYRREYFHSEGHGDPELKHLLGYRHGPGCGMLTHDNDLYLSQMSRAAQGNSPNFSEKLPTKLPGFQQVCIYDRLSILTVEKTRSFSAGGRARYWLVERLIDEERTLQVNGVAKQVLELRRRVNIDSRIAVAAAPVGILVVIANIDGSVELVRFTPDGF